MDLRQLNLQRRPGRGRRAALRGAAACLALPALLLAAHAGWRVAFPDPGAPALRVIRTIGAPLCTWLDADGFPLLSVVLRNDTDLPQVILAVEASMPELQVFAMGDPPARGLVPSSRWRVTLPLEETATCLAAEPVTIAPRASATIEMVLCDWAGGPFEQIFGRATLRFISDRGLATAPLELDVNPRMREMDAQRARDLQDWADGRP